MEENCYNFISFNELIKQTEEKNNASDIDFIDMLYTNEISEY